MPLKKVSITAAVLLLLFGMLFALGRKDVSAGKEEVSGSELGSEASVESTGSPDSVDSANLTGSAPLFDDASFICIAEDGFSVAWSAETAPGDPVFVTLMGSKGTESGAAESKSACNAAASGASASLFSGEKRIAKASFFSAGGNLYCAALPLSTWVTPGVYLLRIALGGERTFEYELTVSPKEFISETIPLNSSNTAIRTDTSDEKMRQIQRLNEVLFSVNPQGVLYTGNHALPVTSTRRTSFFGDRRIFAYSDGTSANSLHYGIDFGVPTGTPVYASAHGRVRIAEFRISTGWTVVLEHFPGLYGLYYHMDSLAVQEGQIVSRQAVLGESGATGLATGPHLHWEVRLNGEAVNPDFLVENSIVPTSF
ncbi:MAG: M23 family metallopeptidase [Spirochaetaceae bacterium]|nr:M23 family metallopeptidase [Spirochaetaceae bacterium]